MIQKSALVLGGSIAGLLAARVLANHFEKVVVVERDEFPTTPEGRAGVPQARHIHILLLRGKQILEQFFPGIVAELTTAGVPELNWTAEALTLSKAGWLPRFESDLLINTCSRDLLEWTVRKHLAAHANVQFMQGVQVIGLLSNDANSRITGIQIRKRETQTDTRLIADFVVDASGRSSKTPAWLQALGYPAPRETVINSFQGYATRWYKRPRNLQADWKALIVSTKPPMMSRGGGIYPVENDQWVVTLGGVNKDFPPTDELGFMEFASSLRTPLLVEALEQAEPISPIHGYQRTENRLRHYEELSALPEGLVVVGDAVCGFNPVYGQGMTAAALGALHLDNCLRQTPDATDFSLRFQKVLAQSNQTPWLMATGEDFRWPNTEGTRPKVTMGTRFVHSYMDEITELIVHEPAVLDTFYKVAHLVKSPLALFQPALAGRVLRQKLRGNARKTTDDVASNRPPTWDPQATKLRV